MQRGKFSYKKELKALFAKAMAGNNKLSEESKGGEGGAAGRGEGGMNLRDQLRMAEGVSKKQRRMLLI